MKVKMETATSYQKIRERQQEACTEERIKEHFEQASATHETMLKLLM